ncbi:MFS transporter [Protaetiibacter sp. SSC-01]|uniref:MFS transporter n=1 Tax=Protaetiibacter sp. SSC-01 TaxID=2759943 RepID=UPI001657457D|nr:MFS transporter [Protaetiibacter sp. SSC-01]QNO36884.1 MFS transporter [Protaetiibacter sp. SSC-01]
MRPASASAPAGGASFAPTVVAFGAAGLVAFAELYGVQALLPAIAREFALTASSAALVQSAGALGLALAVVPWSIVARRVRRGTLLRIAVIATILLSPLVAATDGIVSLLLVRFVQGAVLAGIPALAVTHLGDVLDRTRAAAAAGWYVSGTAIGGLSGRLVAGVVGAFGDWRMALVAVSVLSAIAAAAFLVLTPRVVEVPDAPGAARRALRDPRVLALCALAFLQMGAFVAIYNFIGFRLLHEPFGLPDITVTAVFVVYLVGSFTAARSGRIVARIGRHRLVAAGLAAQMIGALVTLPEMVPTIVLGLVIVTAGFFALHAVAAGWVAELGRGSALPSALYTIAYYAGAAVLGWALGLVFDLGAWPGFVAGLVAVGGLSSVAAVAGLGRKELT